MTLAPSLSLPQFHSSFLCYPLKQPFSPSSRNRIQPKPTSYPRIRALELDQNTVLSPISSLLIHLYLYISRKNMVSLLSLVVSYYIVTVFQVIAITVGVASVAIGIGIPVFYESQIDNAVCEVFFTFTFIELLCYLN